MNSTLLTSRLLRSGTATSLFYEQHCTCARMGRRRSRGTRRVSLSFSCVRLLVKWAKIVFKCQSVWTFIVEPFTWHSVVSVSSAAPSLKVYVLQKKKKIWKKKKKKKPQHYFLQKLTSRLNQGASYQYSRVNQFVACTASLLRVRVQ